MKNILDWFYKLLGVELDEENESIEDDTKVEDVKPVNKKQQPKYTKQVSEFKTVVVVSLTPKVKEDARRAVNFLKENRLIIVDFENGDADRTILSYFVAYLSGAVDALGGVADKFGEYVYLFTPPGVNISREQKKDILSGSNNTENPPFIE
ncbi:MAG TPA: cell division protein SepF [Caldisericia bacterium]|nr:cell division protein SepF [Caldisericia bacterium]HPO28908.1 cell division protein SepF [Caldisericia bacterium]HQG82002.1 cell division protein SepF [Caldisericia bacterium]HXK70872.1 cell division protein SepF [Caldisericia bacterium]